VIEDPRLPGRMAATASMMAGSSLSSTNTLRCQFRPPLGSASCRPQWSGRRSGRARRRAADRGCGGSSWTARDLRREPIEVRKAALATLLRSAKPGIQLSEHLEGDSPIIFEHACKLGCEGIVSKRRGSTYRSGTSSDWIKVKNPNAPAVLREAEEDWDS
jgi:hypothetical protein